MYLIYYTYNISSLIVNVTFNALWSHPPNGNLLLTPSAVTFIMTKVVPGIHVLCQSKICYFDHSMLVNPAVELEMWSPITIICMHKCTHMQFLAARSR